MESQEIVRLQPVKRTPRRQRITSLSFLVHLSVWHKPFFLISSTTTLTALLLSTCLFFFLFLLLFSILTMQSTVSLFLYPTCFGFLLCNCSKLLCWCRLQVFCLCSSTVYNVHYYCSWWCILVFSVVIHCCCSYYDYDYDYDCQYCLFISFSFPIS